jgi:hypothetical protein
VALLEQKDLSLKFQILIVLKKRTKVAKSTKKGKNLRKTKSHQAVHLIGLPEIMKKIMALQVD